MATRREKRLSFLFSLLVNVKLKPEIISQGDPDLENNDLEKDGPENDDPENDDLENNDQENDDLENQF